jgi:hypothetical protein
MTDLPPQTDWYGHATFLAAVGAGIASVFRRGMTQHKVRNLIAESVGPLLPRLAVLEAKYTEIDRRLTELSEGQVRIVDKLERLLER